MLALQRCADVFHPRGTHAGDGQRAVGALVAVAEGAIALAGVDERTCEGVGAMTRLRVLGDAAAFAIVRLLWRRWPTAQFGAAIRGVSSQQSIKRGNSMKTFVLLLGMAASVAPVSAQVSNTSFADGVLTFQQELAVRRLTDPAEMSQALAQQAFAVSSAEKPIDWYIKNKKLVLAELVNHDVEMRTFSMEADGSLAYLGNTVSGKKKIVMVQRDYRNYKEVGSGAERRKVGVLFRIEAELLVDGKNVDVSSLFAVGLAAQRKVASGRMKVRIYGLSGQAISELMPSTSDLSEASLLSALEAVALAKSRMRDADVVVVPQDLSGV